MTDTRIRDLLAEIRHCPDDVAAAWIERALVAAAEEARREQRERIARDHLSAVDLIARGKGERGKPGYVTDETWTRWQEREHVLGNLLWALAARGAARKSIRLPRLRKVGCGRRGWLLRDVRR